jgi:squalene-hopene/tetraprenyl-beta-curcumene cyclase
VCDSDQVIRQDTPSPSATQTSGDPAVGDLTSAIDRGTRFLLGKQAGDGLWHDFQTPAGEASLWPTGFVGTALHLASAPADSLQHAGDALLTAQNDDGGWGYNEDVPTDADSTAWALLLLGCLGRPTPSSAVDCLIAHQPSENGGVATYSDPGAIRRFMGMARWMPFRGWCSPHIEVTAAAGRALLRHNSGRAEAAWRFVRSRQRSDGSWNSYWWTAPHYTTLQAVQLALLFDDDDAVRRAARWALRSQHADGGWSTPGCPHSAFATALGLSILLHANADPEPIGRGLRKLLALQGDDGGWPSHPIMRIPVPSDTDPNRERWRPIRFAGGVDVADQHRTFTSATCVSALVQARAANHVDP